MDCERTDILYVLMRYTPNLEREDVQLEELQIVEPDRLAGRRIAQKVPSTSRSLPSRKVLQSKFPMRKTHESVPPDSAVGPSSSTSPTS